MRLLQQDPTSLDRLHDIVPPEPVSAWPPGPGWFLVAALVLLGLLAAAGWLYLRWRRAAYRREALAAVGEVEMRLSRGASPAAAIAELQVILKRVALAAWPREVVASLSGSAWLEFLDRSGGEIGFTRGLGRSLAAAPYDRRAAEEAGSEGAHALIDLARGWIRRHRPGGAEAC